jgi:hypothetical protein
MNYQHMWTIKDYMTGEHFGTPFTTQVVPLAELNPYDIIAEEHSGDVTHTITLYKIVRINKKTLTVYPCVQSGARVGDNTYIRLWNGYTTYKVNN